MQHELVVEGACQGSQYIMGSFIADGDQCGEGGEVTREADAKIHYASTFCASVNSD
jgi:hypothetical protein